MEVVVPVTWTVMKGNVILKPLDPKQITRISVEEDLSANLELLEVKWPHMENGHGRYVPTYLVPSNHISACWN